MQQRAIFQDVGAAALGRWTFGLTAGVLAAGVAFSAPAAQAQEFDFTMGIIVSPGDVYTVQTASVPERISKATGGRVSVTVSNSLVAPSQIASAVRDGRLPMSAAVHTYLAAEEPRMGIFNLPDLINDIHEYQKVRDAFWAEDVAKTWLEKWNAIVLAEGAWCYTRLFSKEPIHTIEDFRNKRLRVHNPQTAAMMKALGALPTPLAVTEITPALERGVIDGVFTSGCVGGAMEIWRNAPNVQDWRLGPVTGWAILINKDQWKSIPSDLQEQIRGAMAELEDDAFGGYEAFVQQAIDKMKAGGAHVWSAPEEERERLMQPEYTQAAYESWYARAEEVGFDGRAYIDRVRKVLGK